ncbi:hypothetical protein ACIBI3_02305 [Actinomadura luteofluorescens]|uniref:hypothetical protein n=1 Tax=Actinomadura luteofluorescens TaxID=46163 RepID=UPI00346E43EF
MPARTPDQLIDLLVDAPIQPRPDINTDPRPWLREVLGVILPVHAEDVREEASADGAAQWLLELVHVVYGMAKGEHLGPLPQLVPGHAEEALLRVPESVKAAANIPQGGA